MFDFVRKHTKIMMFLLFLLIIPSFVLVGINGFFSSDGAGETVAKIGSYTITQAQWDAAHKNQVDRLRASSPNIDPKFLDSASARYATLERLVQEQVITTAAADMHLAVPDERLKRLFMQSSEFAPLRRQDGSLDAQRYAEIAASQGLSVKQLDARIAQQLSERQLESGVASTAFSSAAQSNILFNAFFERREVQIAKFAPTDFVNKVNPSDADLETYYQSHQALFQSPESADVEYVLLDMDAVKKTIVLSEQDVKSYYEQNADRLAGAEERRASHILINAPKGQSAEERQKAKEQAQTLLAQVRKNPNSFADVARKNSQDPGSAANGGDLDYFGRGAMVKPFEDAVFSMKKDAISDVVESDFGYHIIKLTDIKAPKRKTFEDMRAAIELDLRAQQAQRKFAEVAEVFSNGVYEQSDDLQGIAKKLKLEVKTAMNLSPKGSQEAGVLANPKFLAAVFNPDTIEKKRNTEAIEIGVNQLISARVTRYAPAHTLPLTEVRSQVRERWVLNATMELAKKEGAAQLELWKAQPNAARFAEAVTASRGAANTVSEPLLGDILRAPVATLPAWIGVDLGKQGYAVVRINKVLPRETATDDVAKKERAQYAQMLASTESQAYYQYLKTRYKAQIKVPKPLSLAPEAGSLVQ